MSDTNPFFETWTGPFEMPPFDRIRPEHLMPAFRRGFDEHLAEIEAIVAQPEITFANTLEAGERIGKLLERVCLVYGNLLSSMSCDALEAVAREVSPLLAQHNTRITVHEGSFRRIADLYARRDALGLDAQQMRMLERAYESARRNGATLSPEDKAKLSDLSERMEMIHVQFGQNVMHDENTWALELDEADLDGLPASTRDMAARAARERGTEGKWVITLARSSVEPFLTFSSRRDLRETVYKAWAARGGNPGDHDNLPLIRQLLPLRLEKARLLGCATYADYRLDDTMAKNVAAVNDLLERVWEPAKRRAAQEIAEMADLARAEGMNDAFKPWDWRYYGEKLRRQRFALDEAEVKQYFKLDNVVQAAFATAGRLFGVGFVERLDIKAYHPDVKAYEVREDGGRVLGLFLQDNFVRPGKRSGAWMSYLRGQSNLDRPMRPIVLNNNNIARSDPTLLSYEDARTLFHEFGHGLHGLLSDARYQGQSGTSVRHDFVEFPSQVFEHWVLVPENLRRFARHAQTGEPMPDSMMESLLAARTFNQGILTVEYTASALLDMAFHTLAADEVDDPAAFEAEVLKRYGMPDGIGPRHRPPHFTHLFYGEGYAAGYYAYLWAEVLDADGFAAFEDKGDPFDPELAAGLKAIYAGGDTRDPMELYEQFRGRMPRVEALLKKRGLLEA